VIVAASSVRYYAALPVATAIYRRMVRRLVNDELVPYLLGGNEECCKEHGQDGRCPDRESNQIVPAYETRVLPLRQVFPSYFLLLFVLKFKVWESKQGDEKYVSGSIFCS
jgi:hypothetical protein